MKSLPLIAAFAGLAACTSPSTTSGPTAPTGPTTTNIGGQAAHVGSTYSATQAGALTAITAPTSSLNGQPLWFNSASSTEIAGYESANALAIGGFNSGTLIKGTTGVLSSPAQTGTATYTGRYSMTTPSSLSSGALAIDVNFNSNTFADATAGVMISGNITGQTFSGTFAKNGQIAPLAGGFFGTNEMAGAFGNDFIAGVIYGTKP